MKRRANILAGKHSMHEFSLNEFKAEDKNNRAELFRLSRRTHLKCLFEHNNETIETESNKDSPAVQYIE